MKLLLTTLAALLILSSCNSKENHALSSSSENNYISKRNLDHQNLENFNFTTEHQWDSLNDISDKQVPIKKENVQLTNRTFGWHLPSNGSAYKNYNFSLLWGLSYFSYSIEPKTGNYKNIHQWKTSSIVDSAKAHNCKIFLSVSNFGKDNNTVFLENSTAQNTLIDNLSKLLALRNANGISIDFEGVSNNNKTAFTKFIIQISKKLKKDNANYMVSLCLYARDWNDIFNIEAIDSSIDFYTLMGYDYYGGFSKKTGPVTPFKSSKTFGNGLETSVKYYKNKGVAYDKLIIGLPHYGAEWYTKSPEMNAPVTKFKSHPPYKTIKRIYIDSLKIPVQFDPKSESSYLVFKDGNNGYRQIFFEDKKSLAIKYDWIIKNKISGVGIWALGYDEGYPELWDLLQEKFTQ